MCVAISYVIQLRVGNGRGDSKEPRIQEECQKKGPFRAFPFFSNTMSTSEPKEKGSLKDIDLPFMRKTVQGFIKQVKNASTAEEERSVIANESAAIRSDFGQSHIENLRDNITKLIFIFLLGYPAHYGQMACLELISKQGYSDKRIGYLAMSLFLTDSNDLLLLAVNSVKNDLRHSNP